MCRSSFGKPGTLLAGLALLASAAMLSACGSSDDDGRCSAPVVATTSGSFCGTAVPGGFPGGSESEVLAYVGIPYAASTAGELRWTAPVPPEPEPGIQRAIEFSPICPQMTQEGDESVPQDEDCLALNVWTPGTRGSRPVLVFIHGGSFLTGTGAGPVYRGANLAAAGDSVVVTINYRLGALGFLAGIDGLTGNYGILDQQLALEWVRDNIAGFGGDPSQVMLFGESAGAMSVGIQMTIPESAALFRAAIMESNPYALPYKTLAQAADVGVPFRMDVGCSTASDPLACMRSAPTETILAAQEKTGLSALIALGLRGFLAYTPVIGSLIPSQPNQAQQTMPFVAGTNKNEGTLFIADFASGLGPITETEYALVLTLLFGQDAAAIRAIYDPADGNYFAALAQIATDYLFVCANRYVMLRAQGPVYGYDFTHPTSYPFWVDVPQCNEGDQVCHGVELPFVFGNPDAGLAVDAERSFTPAEQVLSTDMMSYWLTFAANGADPSDSGGLPWEMFQPGEVRQVLDLQISEKSGYAGSHCSDLWDEIGYDLGSIHDRVF